MPATFTATVVPGYGTIYTPPAYELTAERAAEIEREGIEQRARVKAAMDAADRLIEARAIRRSIEIIKHRARGFVAKPHGLNRLAWGLADDFYSDPRAGLRRLDRVEAAEPKVAQFPINIALANIAAARLAFRLARRHADAPLRLLAAE